MVRTSNIMKIPSVLHKQLHHIRTSHIYIIHTIHTDVKFDIYHIRSYIMTIGSHDFQVMFRGEIMPRETFCNLPVRKRHLIEQTAIKEFADRGYDKASVNTIVKKAGIAKGSFYQYFADKEDLFIYLMVEVIGGRKIEYISPTLQNPDKHDFFTLLRELFISGLKFASENPELQKLSTWLMKNTNHPVYRKLIKAAGPSSADVIRELMMKAAERNELRDDIDIDYIARLLPILISHTMEYCLDPAGGTVIMEKVDTLIDFIREGIGTRKKTEGAKNDFSKKSLSFLQQG